MLYLWSLKRPIKWDKRYHDFCDDGRSQSQLLLRLLSICEDSSWNAFVFKPYLLCFPPCCLCELCVARCSYLLFILFATCSCVSVGSASCKLACDLLANHSSAPPCRSPRVSVLPLVIFLPAALLQLCCTFLNFCFYWMLLVFSGLSFLFLFCLDLKSTCQLFVFFHFFLTKVLADVASS